MSCFSINLSTFLVLCLVLCGAYGCKPNWEFHEGYCYLYKRERVTWFDAKVTCGILGSTLVEIRSEQQNEYIKNFIRSNAGGNTWIALEDLGEEGKFVWYPNQDVPQYTNWGSTEPNDGNHNEDCVTTRTDGIWWDWNCRVGHSFICQQEGGADGVIG